MTQRHLDVAFHDLEHLVRRHVLELIDHWAHANNTNALLQLEHRLLQARSHSALELALQQQQRTIDANDESASALSLLRSRRVRFSSEEARVRLPHQTTPREAVDCELEPPYLSQRLCWSMGDPDDSLELSLTLASSASLAEEAEEQCCLCLRAPSLNKRARIFSYRAHLLSDAPVQRQHALRHLRDALLQARIDHRLFFLLLHTSLSSSSLTAEFQSEHVQRQLQWMSAMYLHLFHDAERPEEEEIDSEEEEESENDEHEEAEEDSDLDGFIVDDDEAIVMDSDYESNQEEEFSHTAVDQIREARSELKLKTLPTKSVSNGHASSKSLKKNQTPTETPAKHKVNRASPTSAHSKASEQKPVRSPTKLKLSGGPSSQPATNRTRSALSLLSMDVEMPSEDNSVHSNNTAQSHASPPVASSVVTTTPTLKSNGKKRQRTREARQQRALDEQLMSEQPEAADTPSSNSTHKRKKRRKRKKSSSLSANSVSAEPPSVLSADAKLSASSSKKARKRAEAT